MIEWEVIQKDYDPTKESTKTLRLQVHGGWLLERWQDEEIVYHTFIEDPDHLWLAPEPDPVEGIGKCPNEECKQPAFVEEEKGGHCLICKMRYCIKCSRQLHHTDLTEKCEGCGHVNVWEEE